MTTKISFLLNGDKISHWVKDHWTLLHLLREDMLEAALRHYPHPEQIPQQNIQRARELGATRLKTMLESCRIK